MLCVELCCVVLCCIVFCCVLCAVLCLCIFWFEMNVGCVVRIWVGCTVWRCVEVCIWQACVLRYECAGLGCVLGSVCVLCCVSVCVGVYFYGYSALLCFVLCDVCESMSACVCE